MLLFAEGETATLFSVLGLAVTSVCALGTAYLAYRAGRDRLTFDADVRVMKAAFEECQKDRGEDRALLVELHARATAAEQKAARLEGELAGTNRNLSTVRQVVDDLRGGREQQQGKSEP